MEVVGYEFPHMGPRQKVFSVYLSNNSGFVIKLNAFGELAEEAAVNLKQFSVNIFAQVIRFQFFRL